MAVDKSGVTVVFAAFSDSRYDTLAMLCGLADADHARGKMAKLWLQCTREQVKTLTRDDVEAVLGPRAWDALVRSRLGEPQEDGRIRIKGTDDRTEWYGDLRQQASAAGRKRADGAARDARGHFLPRQNTSGPSGQPATAGCAGPAVTSDPSSGRPAESSPLTLTPSLTEDQNTPLTPLDPKPVKTRRKRAADLTPDDRAMVERILGKITDRTGVAYEGSAAHTSLIMARHREGISESDMRAVIAYCWSELDWRASNSGDGKPMARFLRPETLFGPQCIHKYLAPARDWRDRNFPDLARMPVERRLDSPPQTTGDSQSSRGGDSRAVSEAMGGLFSKLAGKGVA